MRYTEINRALLEAQIIDEVSMSPTALKKFARSAEAEGMLIGIEFEMGVPDVEDVDAEPEWEYDYDQNQSARSIGEIIDFFRDGEFSNMGRREAERYTSELYEQYEDWYSDKVRDSEELQNLVREKLEENITADMFEDQAREELGDEAPDDAVQSRALELAEESIDTHMSDRDGEYWDNAWDEAFEEAMSDFRNDGDFDEEAWLDDLGVEDMQDAEREWSFDWPHMYDSNEGNGGGEDLDSLADEFSQAMGGVKVNTSSGYHGATRDGRSWIIEPDGSIDAERGDAGLEFVSPPMPLQQGLATLQQFYAWAKERGCYTNDSTGLHMNISVPGMSTESLDYVKLALFMGDEYILKQFGRQYNSYCKSAMSKIKDRIRPEDVPSVLNTVKQNLNSLASKIIHSGITEKYTSINTRDKYVEFRGPGGDYLDSDPLDLVNTALRLAMSLRIATDPESYKQEYAKKLYKLVEQSPDADDSVELFSQYALGQINKSELTARLEFSRRGRKLEKTKKDAAGRMLDDPQVKDKINDLPLKWRQLVRNMIESGDQQLQSLLNNIESGEYNEELDQEQRGLVTAIVSNELTYRKQQGEKKQYWVTRRDGEGGKQMVAARNENEAILIGGKNIGLNREQSISQLKAVEKTERSTIELFSGLPADWKEFVDKIEDASLGVLRGGLDSMTTGRWQYRNLDDDEVNYISDRIEAEMRTRQDQDPGTLDNNETRWAVKATTQAYRNWDPVYVDADTPRQAKLKAVEVFSREHGITITADDLEAIATTQDAGQQPAPTTSREIFDSLPEVWQDWLQGVPNHLDSDLQRVIDNMAAGVNAHYTNLSSDQKDFIVNTVKQQQQRRGGSNGTTVQTASRAENPVYQSLPEAHQDFLDHIADKSDMGLINILANPNATTVLNDQQAAYFRIALKHELRRRGINPDTQEPVDAAVAQQVQLINRDDPVTSNDPEAQSPIIAQDGPGMWMIGNHTYGRETFRADDKESAIQAYAERNGISVEDLTSDRSFVAQLTQPAQGELDLREMRRLAGLA